MRTRTFLHALITSAATVALTLLSACGGGGGEAPPPGSGGDGVNASAISFGTITQFGSVWVNGVEYETSTTSVRIDDSPASASELRIGMVVRIDGSVDDRSASAIAVNSAVKGRVEQVLDANRMLVMGQTIRIDAQTRFEDGIVPVVGDNVEVHGLVAGDGVIAGGYIERKATPASPPFAVTGQVRQHDAAARTFAIGALVVSYGAGTTTGDMPIGSWNGLLVEVKGSTCAGSPVCATLAASKIEPGGIGVDDTPHTEIEGFVTSLTADGFVLGSQVVAITAATHFEGGVAADIGAGTKLEVEGSLSAGLLTAVKVSLRDNVRIEGNVASIDTLNGSFTLSGIEGVTIEVNSLTELKDLGSLASLGIGNHVRVKGRVGSSNAMVSAVELERRSTSPDSRVILQGPVAAISGTRSVALLGTVVDTSGVSESGFKAHDDTSIGRASFFAAIQVGSVVKASGRLGGGTGVGWDEMELED